MERSEGVIRLIAAANNSWIVCFDNLSQLPDELADAACRLATGGGSGGQELYSDHDQAVFDAIRPMVFNAIPDLGAARPDFLDRTSIVEFSELKPEMRCDEARFWREFDGARGRILGALLDAAVAGLRNLPEVRIDHPPRMAERPVLGCADSYDPHSRISSIHSQDSVGTFVISFKDFSTNRDAAFGLCFTRAAGAP